MSGEVGVGQQDPNDAASQFNAVAFLVRRLMAAMDTMKLVQVKAVSGGGGAIAAAGTVDVLPLVTQLDGAGNATPHGVVNGVPWWRLQGGHGAVVADPEVGDIGYVVVSDRDISSVKQNRKQSNPGSLRKHNVADGVYVGGVLNDAPTQFLAFTPSGLKVADKNGNVLEMKNGSIEVTTALFKVVGNVQATGTIIAGVGGGDQVGLQTHTHSDPQGGVTGAPTPGT